MSPFSIDERLSNIKLVVCDVDGVLTDGGLYYDSSGGITKRFHVRDGLAVRILSRIGIVVGIISGGSSGATESRAHHLGIKYCKTSVEDKRPCLLDFQSQLGISIEQTAFIGDDINDICVSTIVGLFACPSDSAATVRDKSDIVLRSRGGDGVLREFSDLLLLSRGPLEPVYNDGWVGLNL